MGLPRGHHPSLDPLLRVLSRRHHQHQPYQEVAGYQDGGCVVFCDFASYGTCLADSHIWVWWVEAWWQHPIAFRFSNSTRHLNLFASERRIEFHMSVTQCCALVCCDFMINKGRFTYCIFLSFCILKQCFTVIVQSHFAAVPEKQS